MEHAAGGEVPQREPGNGGETCTKAGREGGPGLEVRPGARAGISQRGKRGADFGLHRDAAGTFRCDFYAGGERIRRSTGTASRKEAAEWCAKVARDAWRKDRLGEAAPITWDAAIAAWFQEKELERKRDIENDRDKARFLHSDFAGRKLSAMTSEQIEKALDRGVKERGWSATTRNRHRSFLTALYNFHKIPMPAVRRLREPKGIIRWLTRDEAQRLLAELPLHLRRMAAFSLFTGLRQSNVTGLRWANVDLARRVAWVHPEDAKADQPIPIPLSGEAVALLTQARECSLYGHDVFVFTYAKPAPKNARPGWEAKQHPILQPDGAAWKKALKRAGIENFRWHDLRHTWASWHVMAGTPLPVLQKLGGWASIVMVQRYAHLAADYTAQFAGNAARYTQDGPKVGQDLVIGDVYLGRRDSDDVPQVLVAARESGGVADGTRTHNNRNHNPAIAQVKPLNRKDAA